MTGAGRRAVVIGGGISGLVAARRLAQAGYAITLLEADDRLGGQIHTVEESLASPELPARVDVVTALHACNTATDDAIRFALARDARHVVLVPLSLIHI